MKRVLVLLLLAGVNAWAELPDGQPVDGRSPKGTYLIVIERALDSERGENGISVERRDRADVDYRIYSYPRFADVDFSPDESYLVINDHSGSGSTECVVLSRINKPPYFVKARKIDEVCWKLFWSLHPKLTKLRYDHRSTYFCEWLDSSHFVVGLQGNHFFPDPGSQKWSLDGGWHCVYDAASGKASTSKYTDAKNKEDFSIEK